MKSSQNRRRFLAALGIGTASMAGCTDMLGSSDVAGTEEGVTDEGPSELEWSTGSDWTDAQERTGVVSGGVGGRDPDALSLGYDPTAEPVSEFDAFWPLDEDDPDTETFADALGDTDLVHDPEEWGFSDEIDPAAPGLFGGTSVEFAGGDALLGEDVPIDPAEDWTMGLWVWLGDDPDDQSHGAAMMLEGVDDDQPDQYDVALGLLPNYDPPAFKIGSVDTTPGYGSEVDRGEWHFHVIRYQASDNRVQGYLDGTFDYSIQPEDGEEWVPDLHDLVLGRRRVGHNDYIFRGRLDAAWLTQGLVSEEDIRRLYETAFEGGLVTAPKPSTQRAIGLEVTAEVPEGTSVSVTVHQDIAGDGGSDVSQTVDIEEETGSYELDGFEEREGSDYWVEIVLGTDDPEVTPHVESIVVESETDD
jgi:hypothetical protein